MSMISATDRSSGSTLATSFLSLTILAIAAVEIAILVSSHLDSTNEVNIASIVSVCLALCTFYRSTVNTHRIIEDKPALPLIIDRMHERIQQQKQRIKTLELEIIDHNNREEEKQGAIQIQFNDIARREAQVSERELSALRFEDSIDAKLLKSENFQLHLAEAKEKHKAEVTVLQAQLLQSEAINEGIASKVQQLSSENIWYKTERDSTLAKTAVLDVQNRDLEAMKHFQDAEIKKLQLEMNQFRQMNADRERIIQNKHAMWSAEIRPLELKILAAERAKRGAETEEKNTRESLALQRILSHKIVLSLEEQLNNLKAKYKSKRIDQLEDTLLAERTLTREMDSDLREADQNMANMTKELDDLHETLAERSRDVSEKQQELSLCLDLLRTMNAEIDDLRSWQDVGSTSAAIDDD